MRIDAIDQRHHRPSSEDEEVGAVVLKRSVAHHFKRVHINAKWRIGCQRCSRPLEQRGQT
eukprot:7191524-Heterocapsa_arctica.AAC.1